MVNRCSLCPPESAENLMGTKSPKKSNQRLPDYKWGSDEFEAIRTWNSASCNVYMAIEDNLTTNNPMVSRHTILLNPIISVAGFPHAISESIRDRSLQWLRIITGFLWKLMRNCLHIINGLQECRFPRMLMTWREVRTRPEQLSDGI